MELFYNELELLQASYNPEEIEHFHSNGSSILKFTISPETCVAFEISKSYPQKPAHISISSSEMTNSEKCEFEKNIRSYALLLVNKPMIMDLVNKIQDSLRKNHVLEKEKKNPITPLQENYRAVITIDHMRQKRKYSKTLSSWASELNACGGLIFCQKWIFLILEGSKEEVKEFIVRLKTVPVDVDSCGKPCKEKMSKILFEGHSSKGFSSFIMEDFNSIELMKSYLNEKNLSPIIPILEACYKL